MKFLYSIGFILVPHMHEYQVLGTSRGAFETTWSVLGGVLEVAWASWSRFGAVLGALCGLGSRKIDFGTALPPPMDVSIFDEG